MPITLGPALEHSGVTLRSASILGQESNWKPPEGRQVAKRPFAKTLPLRDQRPSSLTLTKPQKVLNISRLMAKHGCLRQIQLWPNLFCGTYIIRLSLLITILYLALIRCSIIYSIAACSDDWRWNSFKIIGIVTYYRVLDRWTICTTLFVTLDWHVDKKQGYKTQFSKYITC